MLQTPHPLRGTIDIPGDKSISHRGIMFGSIADGITELHGFLDGADCRSTIACFRAMGISIIQEQEHIIIHGKGLHGLSAPTDRLDVGNSGTTMRLISGILAGQPFQSRINGDASIQKRPMGRIITPLREMGADIESLKGNDCAPLSIGGRPLHPISYRTPVASAQVKSCILLAGLYTDGLTQVTEPARSRNHTELMLSAFGANITSSDTSCTVEGLPNLKGQSIRIPGDISSAAYFIAAGLIVPNSQIRIRNVNINPTRDGILRIAHAMGAKIAQENRRLVSGEPICDLLIESSCLHGTVIEKDIIPTLIDEIPIIAVMAAYADGETVIRDAQELKVKESNRIDSVVNNLSAMGADITATKDGMVIRGGRPLHGAAVTTASDHRIAMSFTVAGLAADGDVTLDNPGCVDISYPTFYKTLRQLQQ